jgi:uncharacterized membrane protein (TIGR02234 family)
MISSPRRLKNTTLIVGILLSGLVLLTWTGQWFSLTLDGKASSTTTLSVTGNTAAPALVALALAGLALVGALAIAGPVIRAILGVVEVLLGFTVGFSAIVALTGPTKASETLITGATGVSGSTSLAALVTATSVSVWPWIAVVASVLVMALGVFVIVTGHRWPGSSRKYQAVQLEPTEPGTNPVADWDSLSGGGDPTSR